MYEEENQADEKSEGLMSSGFAEEMREQVTDGGDVTLYRHKLENGGYQNRGKSKFEMPCFHSSVWHHREKSYMCVNSEKKEHQEKADIPKLGKGHHGCSLRVGDEGQPRTCEAERE